MKKIILIVSIAGVVFLSSCSNQLDCNSDEAKQAVLDILSDSINEDDWEYLLIYSTLSGSFSLAGLGEIKLGNLERKQNKFSFFKGGDGIIESVETVKKSEKQKKCVCKGGLDISEEAYERWEEELIGKLHPDIYDEIFSENEDEEEIPITYNLEITDDGELQTEVYINRDHKTVYALYSIFNNLAKSNEDDENRVFENTFYQSSSGESGYLINSIEDNKIKIEFSTVESDDYPELIATFENRKIILDELPENVEIEDDEFFILNGNELKVFTPEINDYSIYRHYD